MRKIFTFLIVGLAVVSGITDKIYRANQNFCFQIVQQIARSSHIVFTQGLTFLNSSTLIESSGLYGQSKLQIFDLSTNQFKQTVSLDSRVFGQGSTIIKDSQGKNLVYVLTWTQNRVFVYDDELNLIKEMRMPSNIKQGWGLTHYYDQKGAPILLLSDGTNRVYFIEPFEFTVIQYIEIKDQFNNPVDRINELEMIKGKLWANVWMEDYIIEIDVNTGSILNTMNFSELKKQLNWSYYNSNNCLNGIAYNEVDNKLILTGKNWPFFFEIQILGNDKCN